MFAYRLARDLGVPNVDKLLDELSMSQLREWLAFYRFEAESQEKLLSDKNGKPAKDAVLTANSVADEKANLAAVLGGKPT